MNKRIIFPTLLFVSLLSGCNTDAVVEKKVADVKDPFTVQYDGETTGTSTDSKTGEILYTTEYVVANRFKGTDERDIHSDTQKIIKSKDAIVKRYGKSVIGTTYEYAKKVITERGQDFSAYRIASEDTLENLAQIVFTDDTFVFNFCGVKLEDTDKNQVTVYYTMQQIVGDSYEENS